jgi:Putative peptidoglycan binding domain
VRSVVNERWTRIGVPVVLAAGAALVIGIATTAGSSRGASTPAKAGGGVATVQRRDLVATDTESGTLSYADPRTIFNRMSGTVTWLPAVGEVIKPGGTLYKVSGQPVILMNGSVPAYRDLSEGVTDGPDVKELKANLVALGFDPSHQITINNTFDSATTTAVESWQSSLGETQTGVVTLGDVVFLPSAQRITQVNTVLGSTGGASSGSGSSSTTGASLQLGPAQAEFVSLVTTTSATTTSTSADTTTSTTSTTSTSTTSAQNCPTATSVASAAAVAAQRAASDCPLPNNPGQNSKSQALQLQALIALLKAETAELRQKAAGSGSTPSTGSRSGAGSTGASTSGGFSGGGGGGGGGGSSAAVTGGSGGGGGGTSSAGSGSSGSGGGTAQAILQSTSTQVVVTVDLDATKQTEAVVGEPVTVELPDGTTVDGKITEVSPVAQTSSSSGGGGGGSGSGGGAGSGGSSGSPSATIPVTIALTGHRHIHGLDQAAVSVNFEQQKATNVLSVPVTALIATAGGGYAVQEAAAPHQLLPVTPGLFAAGYVQISGSQITPGLQVTDSQG